MSSTRDLLANNQRWAAQVTAQEPHFFEHLAQQQAPKYLWIGCSDSRVPATQVVDLPPGEIFVHRARCARPRTVARGLGVPAKLTERWKTAA